jgi:hypothetical protein
MQEDKFAEIKRNYELAGGLKPAGFVAKQTA